MGLADINLQPLEDEARLQAHIEKALTIDPPAKLKSAYKFVKWAFRPHLSGTERIPDKPCLFIGNHSLFALDGLILIPTMLAEEGRFLRGMGDKFLWNSPKSSDFLLDHGTVMGHPEVCRALMQAGKDLLVFPGGAQEAVKPVKDLYSLKWKDRYGFVRLAAEQGFTIQPFAIVGPDEFYGHLLEGEELLDSRLGRLMKRFGWLDENTRDDILPPIPTGALGSFLPKPKRCFIGFGEPLDLTEHRGETLSKAKLRAIRTKVAQQIEGQMAELLLTREQLRNEDGFLRRALNF